MQLGMIGLERMGSNMIRRLLRSGHVCVVFDSNAATVRSLVGEGAIGSDSLDDLVGKLQRRRAVWVMVPAGAVDLTAAALVEQPGLHGFSGRISDSGERRWTVTAAVETFTPAPVLSDALYQRFTSRGEGDFAGRVLSAMRYQFGGHVERHAEGELASSRS